MLEPRLLAEEKTTNEVDEAVLKGVVTGIERGVAEKFSRNKNKRDIADKATSRLKSKTTLL